MTNMKYSPQTQQRVDTEIKTEIKKVDSENSIEILRSIYQASNDPALNETGRITTVISRFATLLVYLSKQADSIQKRLLYLTLAIVFLTAVLVFITLILLFK